MSREKEDEKFCYLPASRISREELQYFPDLICATKQNKEQFLGLRNGVLQCWSKNVYEQLTLDACLKLFQSGQQKIRILDYTLVSRIFAFLERYGFINFGLYTIVKQPVKRNKHVIVIGAGIAGIIAARQLKSFGLNVTVLEGRERVGGRMAMYSKGPYVADLGAMVVTGSIGNPVITLIEQAKLNLVETIDACHLFDFSGESVCKNMCNYMICSGIMFRQIDEVALRSCSYVSKQKDELIEKEFNRLLEACAYLAHNVDVDQQRPSQPFSLGETMEIIIQMQEKLVRDKQMCHYKTLCNIQERMISVLHKVNRRKADIIRLHDEYNRVRSLEPPSDAEENAVHDFAVRYKRYELDEAWRLFDELMRLVDALEATLNQQEQVQPSDVYLSPKDRRMLDWHFANLEFANAATLDQLSLKHWDQDDAYEFGGFHSTVSKGYANLPVILTEGLNIECGTVVKEISIKQDNCQAKCVNVSKNVSKVIQADAILCTVPLGVLKRCIDPENVDEKSFIKFDPPLPKSKVGAIARLGFGNLNKVVLCFDRIFWDPSRHMFGYINEKTEARGEFFLFWTIYSEPTVVALVAGKSSLKIEGLPDDIIVERCLNVLRTIFSQDQVPQPKETMVTRWATDPFSLGSYSYVAVGASGKDYDILSEPLPNTCGNNRSTEQLPKLFFAGEHTCRRYPATVHGAVISGLKEAGKIATALLGSPIE